MLQIYNTSTRKKLPFQSIKPGKIGIYTCGVTVYDKCHIGHARTFICFDTIVRYLYFRGYQINYIRNITDIDDKIIERALLNNEPADTLASRYINAMHRDTQALGLLKPDEEPCATQFISHMILLIKQLEENGFAYRANNGDVYYSVRHFKSYGTLSKQSLNALHSGNRVKKNQAKRIPLDFVLWKKNKSGEPFWSSPWGNGRPGWHLECSAMSMHYLGKAFDIHGGGADLCFPHHENERAQSEAITGKDFVNYWMHFGLLQINKEKMSKASKNFTTIQKVLREVSPETLRYFIISGHYRSPLEYSLELVRQSRNALDRLYIALRNLPEGNIPRDTKFETHFIKAMDDDFNTPKALSVLFKIAREVNRLKKRTIRKAADLGALLKYLGNTIGLLQSDPEFFFKDFTRNQKEIDFATIHALISRRKVARLNKNWSEADRLREKLTKLGVSLEDNQNSTIWRRA